MPILLQKTHHKLPDLGIVHRPQLSSIPLLYASLPLHTCLKMYYLLLCELCKFGRIRSKSHPWMWNTSKILECSKGKPSYVIKSPKCAERYTNEKAKDNHKCKSCPRKSHHKVPYVWSRCHEQSMHKWSGTETNNPLLFFCAWSWFILEWL